MEILWKGTVSAQFRANPPKLCGNCAFPQNFHTRKLGEITPFFAVFIIVFLSDSLLSSWRLKTILFALSTRSLIDRHIWDAVVDVLVVETSVWVGGFVSFIFIGTGFIRIVLFMDLHILFSDSKSSLIAWVLLHMHLITCYFFQFFFTSNLVLFFPAKSLKAVVQMLFLILSKTNLLEFSKFWSLGSTVAR